MEDLRQDHFQKSKCIEKGVALMAKEVLRTGRLLAQSDPERRKDFEMRTLADYARLNEERQPVLLKLAAAQS